MTREEALNKAINIVRYFEAHFAKSKEAREDAVNIIEALEQQPYKDEYIKGFEDCRQAVLDIVNNPLNIRLDEIIKKLPPVTPQPKMGHWIFEGNQCFSCSSCGRIYTQKAFEYLKLNKDDSDFPNNCPNCGMKMIEPQERSRANE